MLVDILRSHHNVLAKEANMAESTMAGAAAEQLKEKKVDRVIVVARDPIAAGILLNKKEGVEAAVCSSVDDVRLAKDNGANVIIVRDINSGTAHEIIVNAVGGSLRGFKMPQIKVPEVRVSRAPQAQPERTESRHGILGRKKAKRQPEPEEEKEPMRTAHPNSIVGKIKDYLGIV